ncbi:MAG: exosome complex protein Rrp42 [Thermoplasmata archaeon]
MEEIVADIKKDYIYHLAETGKRVDNREFDEVRPIKIETGVVSSAEGSARVKLGSTDVLVGIKMSVGEPFPDTPNSGVLTTNAEMIPMASPTFESGPPSKDAIELARVVDRGIRESESIDLEKLCITPGEKVWILFIDTHILDYGGNLIDAAAIGAISALKTTTVPSSTILPGTENFQLPVNHLPIACTVAKFGNYMVVDPGLDEELIADARLTVTTDEHGNIRAMQKGLSGSFTLDEVEKIVKLSSHIGKEIRKKLPE